jgi:hypothetical protein
MEEVKKEKTIVDEAREIRDDIIKQRELLNQERLSLEKVKAIDMMGGTTTAGQAPVVVEETPVEYRKRIMKGGTIL